MLASLTPGCPVTHIHTLVRYRQRLKTKREKPITRKKPKNDPMCTSILLRTSAEGRFLKRVDLVVSYSTEFFPVFYAKPEVRKDSLHVPSGVEAPRPATNGANSLRLARL